MGEMSGSRGGVVAFGLFCRCPLFSHSLRNMTDPPATPRSEPNPVLASALLGQVRDYAILALDPQGVIATWNAGAEALKGYTAAEAIGQHFSMFYPEADRRSGLPLRLLDEARTQGRVEHHGWRVRKNGERFWGDVVITALRDDSGDLVGFGKVTRDLTEQHLLEAALRESEQRFRVLVSQVLDYAIIALDAQGVIQSWNAGAEKVKGYSAAEAIGQHFSIFYSPEDRRAGLPLRLLDEARSLGRVEDSGWRIRKDGSSFWGDVTLTALHDEGGRLVGFAKVTRDMTERHQFEAARESFLAAITHDLKTPLTAIKGFAELLSEADEHTRHQMATRIEANVDRLTSLIDTIVDHTKLRANAWTPQLEQLTLRAVAESCLANLAPTLSHHEIKLEGGAGPIIGDRRALERVLTNLVGNAVKYSPPGSRVVIRIETAEATCSLRVIDQGRGVAPEDLETVFEEFQQGRLAHTDRHGAGIGLSSVKQLVSIHGGQVWLESEVGLGTTVVVELPRTAAPATSPTPDNHAEPH